MMHELKPLGIIYTCNPSHCFMDTIEELAEKIPIVIINNQNEHLNVDAVELDNSKLGRMMAKHLLDLGVYCTTSYNQTEAALQKGGRISERI